jgi:glycosyltransferase involved in cell wall biosynthesis
MPDVVQTSFLIPAYNEQTLLGRAISSIHESAALCGLVSYEIIVCDNDSTDRTAEIAKALGASVIHEPHRQIARARNAAAEASIGSRLVWLDADATLPPDILCGTIEAFDTGKFCGGGAQVELEGVELDWGPRCAIATWNWVARTFHFAAGSYFFSTREAWSESGGFDELVYAAEEIGFARALKRWGKKHDLKFCVLENSVPSSARKIGQFTVLQTLWQMALCAWPGNLGRRDRCAYWYERPETHAD